MPNLRRTDGMTLLEVMITLGIASIMMVGILQIVNLSQRSTRNVTINADWNNFVSNVKLSLSLDDSCKKYLGGHGYKWDQNGGIDQKNGSPVGTMSQIDRPAPAAMVLAKVKTNYKSFTLSSISLIPQSLSPPSSVTGTYNGTSYSFNVYQASLNMTATKNTMEANSLGGKDLSMSIPIPLTIVTGPETKFDGTATGLAQEGIIYSCHSDSTDPQAICEAMGGQYDTAPPAHCYFPYFSNFSGTQSTYGAVGEMYGVGNYPGARLQLYSKNGGYKNPQPSDYMIGYSDQQMWFNIGGDATASTIMSPTGQLPINSFVWTQVPESGSNTVTHLMALDKSGVLVLNPRLEADNSMLAFGGGVDAGGNLVAPTEKIESHRGFDDLTFSTRGKSRMVIRNDGQIVVGPDDLGTGVAMISFADYTPGNAAISGGGGAIYSGVADGSLTLEARGSMVLWGKSQMLLDAKSMFIDVHQGEFGVGTTGKVDLTSTGSSITLKSGGGSNVNIDAGPARLYVTGKGIAVENGGGMGLVPYGCSWGVATVTSDVTVPPLAISVARCPAGQTVYAGGCYCDLVSVNPRMIKNDREGTDSWSCLCLTDNARPASASALCCSQ
ncbi:prepilin-type N-terminal cleavage/methylation domain-containing protein [Bdellovibrionota bacterium FG-1]